MVHDGIFQKLNFTVLWDCPPLPLIHLVVVLCHGQHPNGGIKRYWKIIGVKRPEMKNHEVWNKNNNNNKNNFLCKKKPRKIVRAVPSRKGKITIVRSLNFLLSRDHTQSWCDGWSGSTVIGFCTVVMVMFTTRPHYKPKHNLSSICSPCHALLLDSPVMLAVALSSLTSSVFFFDDSPAVLGLREMVIEFFAINEHLTKPLSRSCSHLIGDKKKRTEEHFIKSETWARVGRSSHSQGSWEVKICTKWQWCCDTKRILI